MSTISGFEVGLLKHLYKRQKIIEKEVINAIVGANRFTKDLNPEDHKDFRETVIKTLSTAVYNQITETDWSLLAIKQEPN